MLVRICKCISYLYYGAVQCFHFHGLVPNKLETAPPKSSDWQTLGVSQGQQEVGFLCSLPLSKVLTKQTTFFGIDLILQVFENTLQVYFNLKITPNHLPLLTHSWATVQNVAYCQENN